MKRPVIITLLIVALALVCVGIGSVIFFANNFAVNNPFDVMNIPSVLEESKTLEVDAEKPVTLKVQNDSGAVTITGADVEAVEVQVVKTAFDTTQARADAEVKTIKYTVQQNGNTITLKYALPRSMNFNNQINTVDFIVTVPNQTNVDVDTNFGGVSISNIEGEVVAQSDFGETSLDNVQGAVSASTNNGTVTATAIRAGSENIDLESEFGSITLEKANGKDITIDTSNGSAQLDQVRATGTLSASSEFGGVTIENGSADSLTIETTNGDVSLSKLTVKKDIQVDDEFGSLELDQVFAASYDLDTNNGHIAIDGVKGKITASSEFGSIEITNAESVTIDLRANNGGVTFEGSLGVGPHVVRSEFGSVDLTLPADANLNVDLSTEFGSIKSDMPITITLTETTGSDLNRDQIVGSINDGGDLLTVETNNGSLTIHAGQ